MYTKYQEPRLPVNFGFLRIIGREILARNILGPGTFFCKLELRSRASEAENRYLDDPP